MLILLAASFAVGQVEKQPHGPALKESPTQSGEPAQTKSSLSDEPQIWVHLVGGRRIQVAEVTEDSDGFWFKVGNVTTFVDRKRVARIERSSINKPESTSDQLRGSGIWKISDSARVEAFFLDKFGRRLPLTAFGQSDLHTRWGYDHRQGMDIGLHPDSPEGRGLIEFLRSEEIPFLAFRGAVPGVATGPHIHIGNPSRKLSPR